MFDGAPINPASGEPDDVFGGMVIVAAAFMSVIAVLVIAALTVASLL